MTKDLRESLERIRKLSPDLNRATNQATAAIERVETFLEECSLGVAAEVGFSEKDVGEDHFLHRSLVYERIDGKFRFGVTEVTRDKYTHDIQGKKVTTIWSSCPRETKLKSIKVLQPLLIEIAESAQDAVTETEASINAIEEIAEAMNGK